MVGGGEGVVVLATADALSSCRRPGSDCLAQYCYFAQYQGAVDPQQMMYRNLYLCRNRVMDQKY